MVKLANVQILPVSSNLSSFNKLVEMDVSKNSVSITMTKQWMSNTFPDCAYAGYWQKGGS